MKASGNGGLPSSSPRNNWLLAVYSFIGQLDPERVTRWMVLDYVVDYIVDYVVDYVAIHGISENDMYSTGNRRWGVITQVHTENELSRAPDLNIFTPLCAQSIKIEINNNL